MKGGIFLALTAVGWSTAGMFVKLIPWNPFAVAGVRGFLSFFMLLAWRKLSRKRFPVRAAGKGRRGRILLGFFQFATSTCYLLALRYTTAANAVVLQYIAPVLVLLYGTAAQKKKPDGRDVFMTIIVCSGCVLAFIGDLSNGFWLGNCFAVLSGFALAGQILCSGASNADALDGLLLGSALSAVCFAPFYFRMTPSDFTLQSVSAMLLLGVVQYGLSNVCYVLGIGRTDALSASLILTLEPVLAPVWTFFTLGEKPSALALTGLALVAAGNVFHALQECSCTVKKRTTENKS